MHPSSKKWFTWIFVLSIFVLFSIRIPWISRPLNPYTDDAFIMQAVSRALNGKGFTISAKTSDDLSKFKYKYLVYWPPGIQWTLFCLQKIGLPLQWAYKLASLVFLSIGLFAWLAFARRFIGPFALACISAGFVIGLFGPFYIKLGHALLWAAGGFYFWTLFEALSKSQLNQKKWFYLSSCAGVVGILSWYGFITYAAAAGLAVLLFLEKSFLKRIWLSFVVAGPCLICFAIIKVVNFLIAGKDYEISHHNASFIFLGWHQELFPLRAISADLGGTWHLLEKATRTIGLTEWQNVLLVVVSVGMFVCATFLIRKKVIATNLQLLLWIGLCQFLFVFPFLRAVDLVALVPLSVSYVAYTPYWSIAISTFVIFWGGSIFIWWKDTNGSQARKKIVMVLICTLFLSGFLYLAIREAKWSIYEAKKPEFQTSITDFIQTNIKSQNLFPHLIFDVQKTPYIWTGELTASEYLTGQNLAKKTTSQPVYVFVVVRKKMEKNYWLPDPRIIEQNGIKMVDFFNLQHQKSYADNRIAVYGGWVKPGFSKKTKNKTSLLISPCETLGSQGAI